MGKKASEAFEDEFGKIRHAANDLSKAIGKQAKVMAHDAQEWAEPRYKDAKKNIVKAAAPKIEAAAGASADFVDSASHKITDDYLPRIQQAMHEAAAAVQELELPTGRRTARKARKNMRNAEKQLAKELAKAQGKHHRGRRVVGWFVVGTAAAGAGYLLWRRSQPVEDPWAEEYWQNSDEAPAAPAAASEPLEGADGSE